VPPTYKFLKDSGVSSLSKRLSDGPINRVYSWVDFFFFADIHILGFAFGFDEMHLWWLLSKRSRLSDATGRELGRIRYYGQRQIQGEKSQSEDMKRDALSRLGVEVIEIEHAPNYWEHYRKAVAEILKT
jgi:hypothetical protein